MSEARRKPKDTASDKPDVPAELDEEAITKDNFQVVDRRRKVVIWCSQFLRWVVSLGAIAVLRGTVALLLTSLFCYFQTFGGTNGLLAPVMTTVFDHKRYVGGVVQMTFYYSICIVLGLGVSLLCTVISTDRVALLATQFVGVFFFAFLEVLFPKWRGALVIGSLFLAFEIFAAAASDSVPVDGAIELAKALYAGLAVSLGCGLLLFPKFANNAIRTRTADFVVSTQGSFRKSVDVFLSIPDPNCLKKHNKALHAARLEEGPHFQHSTLTSGRDVSRAIYADLLTLFSEAEGELSWSSFSQRSLGIWRIRLTELLQFEESLGLNRRNLRKRLRMHHRESDLSELICLVRAPIEELTEMAWELGENVAAFLRTGVNERVNQRGEKEKLVGKYDFSKWNSALGALRAGQLKAQQLFLSDAKWEDSEWDEVNKQFFFYIYSFVHYLETLRQMELFLSTHCSKKSLHFIIPGRTACVPNLQGCFGDKMDIWHQPFHGFGKVYDPPPHLPPVKDERLVLPLDTHNIPPPSPSPSPAPLSENGPLSAPATVEHTENGTRQNNANNDNTNDSGSEEATTPPDIVTNGGVLKPSSPPLMSESTLSPHALSVLNKHPAPHVWSEFNLNPRQKPSFGWREGLWSFLQLSNSFQFKAALKMSMAVLFLSIFAMIPSTQAFFADWRMVWAVVTVMVVMSPYFSDSFTNGFWRFMGTIMGALFGLLAWAIFGTDKIGIGFMTILAGLVGFYLKHNTPQYSRLGYVFMVTYILVVLTPYLTTFDPLELSYKRGLMILLGVAVSIVFGRVFFPYLARTQLRVAVSTILFRLSDIYTFEKHLTSRDDLTSEQLVDAMRWLTRQHDKIHLALVDARGLADVSAQEPRLRAPFPLDGYRHLLNCCQRMLTIHRFMVSLVSTGFSERLYGEVILPLNSVRHEMTANVVMFFYLLASCLRMKIPLPVYMPPALKSRERVRKRFHQFLHLKQHAFDERMNDLMHWLQYAGLGRSIVLELEEAGKHIRNDLWF